MATDAESATQDTILALQAVGSSHPHIRSPGFALASYEQEDGSQQSEVPRPQRMPWMIRYVYEIIEASTQHVCVYILHVYVGMEDIVSYIHVCSWYAYPMVL